MDNRAYSNREIDEKWAEVANSLSRIEIQTTTTNGRVKKLESWQSFMQGGMAVLTLLFVPILIYLILHWPK